MLEMTFSNKTISTYRPAFVMGIVNVTPDSFYYESRGFLDKAIQHANKLIEEGCDILDIGGESTRPGFSEVPVEEEIKRIIPVIKEIRKNSDITISIDTRKSKVFEMALNVGADFLNDVSSLEFDLQMKQIVKKYKTSVVLMDYKNNSIEKVNQFLMNKIEKLSDFGIEKSKFIVDPGIGFGKTEEESINIIKNTNKICEQKYPILMALSRKRCIGFMTNQTVENRLYGTITANIFSVQKGAKIIRVHDVKETIDSLNVMKYLQD